MRTEGGGGSVTIAKTAVKLLKSFVIPRQTKKKTQDPVLCRVSCTILAVTYFGGGGITIGCTVLQRAIYLLLCEIAKLLLFGLSTRSTVAAQFTLKRVSIVLLRDRLQHSLQSPTLHSTRHCGCWLTRAPTYNSGCVEPVEYVNSANERPAEQTEKLCQ